MKRNPKKKFRLPRCLALLALAMGTSRAAAQSIDWFQPQGTPAWTYLMPRLRYVDTDLEYESDVYTSGGTTEKTVRYYVSPTAGIEWANYIRDPRLLNYSLLFEPGYIWQESGSPGKMSQTDELALDGQFTANLLDTKPYATSVNYLRSEDQIKYDFFNSATVDTESWGASSGFHDGPVPVTLSFQQSDVNSMEPGQNSDTGQTTVNLEAHNDRPGDDSTQLTYQFGEFNRQTDIAGFSYSDDSNYHHASLMDVEHYQKSTLRSSLLFDEIDSGNSLSSSDLNGVVDYNIQHTPHLSSDYNYALNWYDGDGSQSTQNTASASVHHQLYDSLTSSLELQGSSLNNDSSGSTLDTYSGQLTGSEQYSKRLGGWGHLSISETASYTLTDQEANGSQNVIANESHTVPNNGLIILDQPLDLSISTVTDSTGTLILQPGLDYTVNTSTDPWQIQINSGGPNHIAPGSTVLVTYTIHTNPSGSYSVFVNDSEVRVSFWGDKADVFALYNLTDNQSSSPGFLFQNENEFQAGTDFNWKGLSLSGSYIDDTSTLYDNQTYNLGQSYSRALSPRSRAGINLSEQWSAYSFNNGIGGNQNQNSTFYNAMLNFEWHPIQGLSWNAEAGVQKTTGSVMNEDLLAARTYLTWRAGKLEVHLGYEHENQNYTTERMKRDYAFFRIRRNF